VLDEEVSHLPERLRLPFVLCYLEGKTNEEAARQLGCPPGTVYSRLARGREILRARLLRRGVTLSAGLLTTLVCRNAAGVAPAVSLVDSTLEAALRFEGGRAAGVASAQVVALAEGVLQAMFFTKFRIAALALVVLGALAAGGVLTHEALRADQQPPAKREDPPAAPPGARKDDPERVKVRVVKPTPAGTERRIQQAGTVRPYAQQQVYAAVAGYVKEIPVDIGDQVKKGQVLAVIDAPILVAEADQAAAAAELARAQVQEAEARVGTAAAELKAAKDLLTLREDEGKKGLTTAAALAIARSDVPVKESKVAQARAALMITKASVEMARAAVGKAQLQLGFTRLVSSYDGVVTRRTVDVGDYVQTGDPGRRVPLLTVQRTDLVRVVAQIPESDVPFTERGNPVDIEIPALPGERFSATVSRIGFAEDEATRTMPVEIDVPNPKGLLRSGMYGQVHIHLKGPPRFWIPRSCVLNRSASGERYVGIGWVYVVRDGKAHQTRVRMGQVIDIGARGGRGGDVEILSGLKPSDRVVIDPKGLTGDVVPVEVKDAP
jgi:RND family efflux transporter MFP subunit